MDSPADTQQPTKASAQSPKQRTSPAKTTYLILYNSISALLWSVVLGRVLLIASIHGYASVYTGAGNFTKWTQTLAGLEVLHAATGLVRAPLLTTLMQVASRYLLVWGIVQQFPHTTGHGSPAYSTMLVAWSVTEVIRYTFFAVNLGYGSVPKVLMWLRYNTFFVLYPLGISSECWLVWKALMPARSWNLAFEYVLKLVLFVYIPGSYVLFTHMMAQRRKVMRGNKKKKAV
ncbi:related to protein tyrosine phosphatase-like protein (putative anti-phosphatase); pepino protein; pasticcino protein pas2 [Ramularia collo-cygni]|uniref:Very-long-chain (3R)-3-hydroxyacyl-CoA dehydratase n=1 Tax=Ramularia collo-cygni TaxID=112498 RepID=A0A2D3V981_9PEZI|nr:related to protein tyrosine phosphatase-like protein (putative anti-phosphatase); pepino protein; pasticcino protein pas2 [Ramularia collo-cygni]CZT23480.1 related to protein tyrosine phosphatase-like protein (putative anti-phosphatase); pepino protein; pasticcino protein pas2 [Ramularia collo-cygni]